MTESRIDLAKFKRIQDEIRASVTDAESPLPMTSRARLRLVKDQLKEARVGRFTLLSDEPAARGGGGEHPLPLQYFTAGIGF